MLTKEQIDSVRKQAGLQSLDTENATKTPIRQRLGLVEDKVEPKGDTGLKGVATGTAKGLLESAIGTSRLLQTAGQGVMTGIQNVGATIAPDLIPKTTFAGTKEKYGVKSLQGEQAEQIDEMLKAKSTEEKVGKGLAFGAEIINPLGRTEEAIALTSKAKKGFDVAKTAIKARKATKEIDKLVEATSGVLDKKSRISALERSGLKGGAEESLTGGIEVSADDIAIKRAEAVRGIVKPGASPVKNLNSLNQKISEVSEKEILPALKSKPAIFNVKTIESRLNSLEKPDIIKADITLDKTYELVRQRMIDQVRKQPKTMEGLWNARKEFDKVVKDQFGDVAFDSEKNTAIKRAISDMRKEINNFIGDEVPEYKEQLNKLSSMYDARYNIAEQFQDLVNQGGFTAWKTQNPKKWATLKWGGTITGLGAGKELLGL
jgi:hypothetical protein